jgi:NADH:ubiquinone oxidoreductase subunit E
MREELVQQFSDAQISAVDSLIESYSEIPGSLLIVLEEVQKICSYLPLQLQRYIAQGMNVSASSVQGVVTFYSYFSTVPKGRNVI